ncbi:MAG: hypothetical protein WB767_07855 [Nocardioides sp.]
MGLDVLLATCTDFIDGEPGHEALDAALVERGISARWALWDDVGVDWSQARLVAVRATWDYETRLPEFLEWADSIGPSLLNGAAAFRWNTDKRYLVDLATSVPVVPTVVAATADHVRAALADRPAGAVVKPTVAAGGRGLRVVAPGADWDADDRGPWIVQPLVESIHTLGEQSIFVLGGQAISQVHKLPASGEVRVHEFRGGTSEPVTLDADLAELAVRAADAAGILTGAELSYVRVDLLHHDGAWCVSEVELTEPGLYLDVVASNGAAFADVVASALRS